MDTLKKVPLLRVICVLIELLEVSEVTFMGKTRCVSKIFNVQQIKQLEGNPYVLRVPETTITYAPAFKVSAVD